MLGKKVSLELFFFACLVSVLWSLICGFLKIFNENSKVVEKSRRWWEKRLKTVCVQNHYIVQKIRNKKWKAKLASFSSWSYPHNMPFLSEKKDFHFFENKGFELRRFLALNCLPCTKMKGLMTTPTTHAWWFWNFSTQISLQNALSNIQHAYGGKKSPQSVAYSQTQFATLSQNDVKNVTKWWILMLRENAEFWFKKVQNAWIHSPNWFTF